MIGLAGPLLLFNPWLTSALQDRHGVPEALGSSGEEVDRVTGSILVDLYTGGDFGVGLGSEEPLLDEAERSHMRDVSRFVRLLWVVVGLAGATMALSAALMRHEPGRVGRLMLLSAGGVGTAALILAIVFAVAFEPAFLAFHAIFFPPGTYLFAAGSELILLFPSGFWFDAALAAGASIVVTALGAALIGLRLWRRPA